MAEKSNQAAIGDGSLHVGDRVVYPNQGICRITGVATKTTYATFLLYSLFNSGALDASHNARALIFNVKGEDLLFLDSPNARLSAEQRDRYRDAQGHLSSFDRHLTKGHFDKGELDKSIDKIKDILDHNVLQASSRDALLRDLDDLKAARDRRW